MKKNIQVDKILTDKDPNVDSRVHHKLNLRKPQWKFALLTNPHQEGGHPWMTQHQFYGKCIKN
jgi:hypothetical protein